MSDKKFTKEQENVITEKNKNLMVSASAGSGKTTVMIERLAKLIEDGKTTLDRVLVLTFTNNSANDMKKKLYEILSKKNSKNCKNAMFGVSSADISNIHQFCKKLIQKYFFYCDVDPAFIVASESEALSLKDMAFNNVIKSEFFAGAESLDQLLEDNFEKRNFEKIKTMILSIYNYLNVLDNPKEWLNKQATFNYEENLDNNNAANVVVETIKSDLQYLITKTNEIENHINEFLNICNFEDVVMLKNSLQKIVNAETNTIFLNKFLSFKAVKKDYSKKDEIGEFRKQEITPLFKNVKTIFDNYKKTITAESVKDIEEFLKSTKADAQYLCVLAEKFVQEYQAIKAEKFVLDFNDLEKKAYELLSIEQVQQQIQEKYDFCFVDEYQDINNLQEALLSLVSKKSKYFGVGDAKQAIYGFRLCSPEIFINKFKNYEREPNQCGAILLNKNFRSLNGILNFSNKIFDVIMTDETSQINYAESSRFDVDKTDDNSVQIILGLKDKQNDGELPKIYSVKNHDFLRNIENQNAKVQATIVANVINNLVKDGVKYSDIAILSRKKSGDFVKGFCENLMSLDIPMSTSFDENLLIYTEIATIHYLLKLINNFKDDIVLIKVLTNPVFDFKLQELLDLKKDNGEKFFYETFLKNESSNLKIANFINQISRFRAEAQNKSVLDFIKKIIIDLDLYNLSKIYDEKTESNIFKYLNYISSIKPRTLNDYCLLTSNDEIICKSVDIKDDSNSVSIGTIHSSKGLEYKNVILIGCDKNILTEDQNKSIAISKELGVGIKTSNDEENDKANNLIYGAVKLTKKKEYLAEEIRLLYVALTRAKEKMFIVGTISDKQINELKHFALDKEVLSAKSYLELILNSFSNRELNELKNNQQAEIKYGNALIGSCCVLSYETILKEFNEDKHVQVFHKSKDCVEKEKIKDNLLNYKKLINLPHNVLKNNVSAINKKNIEEVEYGSDFFSDESVSVSSTLGTAYHEVFAKLNFDGIEKDLVYPKVLDKNIINIFLNSSCYKNLNGKKILKETPFLLFEEIPKEFGLESQDKVLLQGVIDLLVICENGFYIVDYKATHKKDEQIVNTYKSQLNLYAFAGEKILQKKCLGKIIYKIFDGKTIEIE